MEANHVGYLKRTLQALNEGVDGLTKKLELHDVKEMYAFGKTLLRCDLLRQAMHQDDSIGNRRIWQRANHETSFANVRSMIEFLLANGLCWCEK